LALGALFLLFLLGPARAQADVVCPNPVPVVNENQCHTGTSAWQVNDYSQSLGGFTTKTSVDLGESVTLKIARNGPVSPTRTVNIAVYRMGYYDGLGGRLVNSASNVAINNNFECEPMDSATGEVDCGNWKSTYTIPANAFPASGVYLAKLTASTGDETQVVFTVRDDDHQPTSRLLYVLPIASYQAYNLFGGKSLYFGTEGGNTAAGTSRAVKVSFNRPFSQAGAHLNWFTGPDYDMLFWLEKQGYDVAYTDDVQVHSNPAELLNHDVAVIPGHSEYWSEQEFKAFLAARNAGVNIASFSANTAYWKVRYEDGARTLVCYKTVEGAGWTGSGALSDNDWGPDGVKGTADDALGLDGKAGTADDNPQNSTTTFRDNGAPPSDPNAPTGGRVGPDMPENQIFGVMYMGDNDSHNYPITVPPGNAAEEFAADRVWRNTGIAENTSTNIGSVLVGWEWDAVPTQAQYLSRQPSDVTKLYATNVQTVSDNTWLQDEGWMRNNIPPPGQPGTVGGVRYTAPSGAEVFASGSMEWAYGLSSDPDERLEQATYNIFSDMGVQPDTPDEDLTLDPAGSNRAPNGGFTISQNPAKTSASISFDASVSNDPDGLIAKYEWDFDGNGSFETNSGSKAVTTHSYAAEGEYTVRLRVTDNGGATDVAVRTLTIINNLPPTASFTTAPAVIVKGEQISFDGSGSKDTDGTIAKYEWDFDGNGSFETSGGSNPVIGHTYATKGSYTVGLRVTDNGGKTATTTRPISVNSGEVSKYTDSVLATSGLQHYWRMGETSGSTFADSAGSSPATAFGGPSLGLPGGVVDDPDRSAGFDGVDDAAKAAVNLSGTHAATVEFWLKWDSYANNDRLAMEFTNNFNEGPGGFLVDPNAPQFGGSFGVGIGASTSRNTVFFARPSAGEWHHYAFVLDTTAVAAQQITPYVDGKAVAFQKTDSGTGAGNFANSTLNMMSRAGSDKNFGAGGLDEVAIYKRTLGPTTIADHYNAIVPSGGGEGGEEGGGEEETGGGTGGEGPATYSQSILGTSNVLHYWRMGEAVGPTLSDGIGSSPATTTGGPTFGVPGALSSDANTAVRFDGGNDAASATVNLAAKSAVTVEFWLKWNAYANNDRLAMELTNNFNDVAGGFLVDPNAPQLGGTFGVAIGRGVTRNNVFFSRPTAGQWHHYAFVLDTAAAPAQQITPYVDGKAVAFQKTDSGTGAGNFANSTLNMMSRAGSDLFGPGDLDDVSLAGGALSAATIADHFKGIVPQGGGSEEEEEEEEEEETGGGQPSAYADAVLGTPGLADYWRLGETTGSIFANSAGISPATASGGPTLGVPGAIAGDPNTAVRFDGANDAAAAPVDLSGKTAATIEFWMKWNSWANDDALAFELTDNFNSVPGGFLIDPNSSYGSFAVAIGFGASRNVALFPRPTAGEWHHYAFAMDTTAPASEAILPYVDGKAVAYTKAVNGSGAPPFANAALNFMSRAGSSLFGAGDLDEVAVYDRALSGATVANHYQGLATNLRPSASFKAPPSAKAGTQVTFDASASKDPDGTIAKYEWDLDGNGSYETDTGTTPVASATYTIPAGVKVSLRVTDNAGAAATMNRVVAVEAEGGGEEPEEETGGGEKGSYSEAVLATAGLNHYWRLGETAGSILADSFGSTAATTSGEPTLGVAGSIFGDPNTAVRFDGANDAAAAPVDLSGKTAATIEFWMKWNSWANDDALAFELTDNFNSVPGGFLIDPNSSYGSFAVAIGFGASRNVALFPRPTAGEWHHYAFAMDTTAPASEAILPYVDGKAVAYTKAVNGSGAPPFANAALNFMSRAGSSLFGAGDLDEVAVYDRALSGATVANHYALTIQNTPPEASFTASPNPAPTGGVISLNASASKDPDGTIAKYEWDLDGNGSYETNTGKTAAATASYATPGAHSIGLRVTDGGGATATTTRTVTVQNQNPTASFLVTPNPAFTGSTVSFDAAASGDPDGTIAKYEWDLDGNGTYETDAGTSASSNRSYPTIGTRQIGLRVTDNNGATATTTRSLSIVNTPPTAAFTSAPNPAPSGTTISFDASASSDSDGSVAKYEWDFDGNGSYETNAAANAIISKSFTTPGNRTVGLRITDNNGATATTSQTVSVENRVPSASFTATPGTALSGVAIAFNATASSDPDGTISKYEWDFDGNGSYEADAGATASTSHAFFTSGTITVGLRVTDNSGATATTTRTVTIQNSPPTASFSATPNSVPTGTSVAYDGSGSNDIDGTIVKYEWDLDGNGTYETSTGTIPSASSNYATAGARTIRLRVTDSVGATATTTQTVTVTNRAPVPAFAISANPVQSLVNVTLNASASSDPDGTIAKYEWDLDGNGSYEVNAGSAATTSRSFSTSGERAVGLRVTDNLGATATTTLNVNVTNRAPTATFTASPSSVPTGTNTTLSAAASGDQDGTIVKYEWDLDGNGSYETSSGATSSLTTSYATAGTKTIGLRATDNLGATATTTRTVSVTNRAPTAAFTVTPNPVTAGATVSFNATGSVDPDGTISKYEWDLDGNGSYEVNAGATATTSKSFTPAGSKTIGLRVTDNSGATGTTTQTLTVRGPYNDAISSTPGLIDYWRLGESSGTTLANSVAGAPSASRTSSILNSGATLGVAGPLTLDPNTAISFDGSNDDADAGLNLSSRSTLTIEFWMKWNSFSNNDDLAFEFTSNFNNTNGGFLVNPNSTTSSSRFEVALGRGTSRNNAYFTRPSANVWHHYAIVMNTAAAAAQQILVYVDGAPVSIVKGSSGTGAGNFANSTLNFMSRNGSSLFGAGALDEVAIYGQALSAAQISQHFAAK
jgi:PKD repeat protein